MNLDSQRYSDEIVGWVIRSIEEGFAPFQCSFMFKPLLGNSAPEHVLLSSMSRGIYRFYSTALTRFHRRPLQLPLDKLLRLIACPDWPVGKDERKANTQRLTLKRMEASTMEGCCSFPLGRG
jgi:hypothetical protein